MLNGNFSTSFISDCSLITLLIFVFYVKLDIVLDAFKYINSFDKYIARTF